MLTEKQVHDEENEFPPLVYEEMVDDALDLAWQMHAKSGDVVDQLVSDIKEETGEPVPLEEVEAFHVMASGLVFVMYRFSRAQMMKSKAVESGDVRRAKAFEREVTLFGDLMVELEADFESYVASHFDAYWSASN